MDSFFLFLLIAITVGPLLLLALYVLADYFGLRIAPSLLDALFAGLKLQWLVGSWLNFLGGLAIAALGVGLIWQLDGLARIPMGALLVGFGLWRSYRGLRLIAAGSSS